PPPAGSSRPAAAPITQKRNITTTFGEMPTKDLAARLARTQQAGVRFRHDERGTRGTEAAVDRDRDPRRSAGGFGRGLDPRGRRRLDASVDAEEPPRDVVEHIR